MGDWVDSHRVKGPDLGPRENRRKEACQHYRPDQAKHNRSLWAFGQAQYLPFDFYSAFPIFAKAFRLLKSNLPNAATFRKIGTTPEIQTGSIISRAIDAR